MPLPPDPEVRRPRLLAMLADKARAPVTLVSAAPGAGKTTLLASWLRSERRAPTAAWLTVHHHDDDPVRFSDLVVHALSRSAALTGPVGRPRSGEALLDAAFEQVLDRQVRCVLIVEEVQELRSPGALATLAYLVEFAPAGLDIVLSTRADPPIGWERPTLSGRVGQIRDADLAFTEAETAALVAAHGVSLSPTDIRTLRDRTEGWAAGLRLALGALQTEPDPHKFVADAAATEAAVSDYLLSEVVGRQEENVQEFLLRTSVAARLTPDLVIDLTGDDGSAKLLMEIAQRGLFIVKLDGQNAYRYHSLVQALLQAHLNQHDDGLAAEVHRRAAAWHLAHGMGSEAEHHARAAGDWAMVGRLMLDRWLHALTRDGDDPSVDAPLHGVPTESILRTPELALMAATEACRWSRREEADLYRAALDTMVTASPDGHEDDPRRATGETARLLLDLSYGWSFGADDRSRAAVATLQDLDRVQPTTPRLRQLAALAQAEHHLDTGELDQARRMLEEPADRSETPWHRRFAAAAVAVIDAASGAVAAAEARLADVVSALDDRTVQPTSQLVRLATALCTAQQRGPNLAPDAPGAANGPVEWSSRSLRYLDRAVGAAIAGREPFFVQLDRETAEHPLAAQALIALGVFEVVDAQGRRTPIGGEGEQLVLQARQQLTNGAHEGRSARLTAWLERAPSGHPRTAIEARVLAAIAAHRRADQHAARRALDGALQLATATTICAPLLAHRQLLRPLLEAGTDGSAPPTAATFALVDRLLHPGALPVVDPLTDRERQILQHLPTLMSNVEIARGMHLSVNTVKTHLKAVYRKLGVHGRRDAVLRGRELELL